MPDYYCDASRPLDVIGLALFGTGTAVLSWLLEIFGEHEINIAVEAALLLLALTLLAAYWRHARQTPYPLLQLALFKVQTFRVSVIGGFITRLGVGGLTVSDRAWSAGVAIGHADDANRRRRHGHEAYFHAC